MKKKTKKQTKAATSDNGAKPAGEPLQADLPGMEDAKIAQLEALAEKYAEIRDDRIALNKREVDLKEAPIAAMHEHEKETYRHNGISIELVHEEETVKVKIAKDDE